MGWAAIWVFIWCYLWNVMTTLAMWIALQSLHIYIFLLQLTVRGVCTVLHSKLCGAAELLVVEGQV